MSNFPKKIDTSIELPIARNNITELSSDILNKMRDAILKIEIALGTEINGSVRSLSERLSESIQSDGKLKESSISHLNVLTGKIRNHDVSLDANISEEKLDLDYSTKYLKSQILSISSDVDSLIKSINDYTSLIKIHLDKDSLSAHSASQIDLTDSSSVPATTTSKIIQNEDSQSAFERIYNEHINLSPDRVTESSNSHLSDQIFYNNPILDSKTVYSVKEALDYIISKNSFSDLGSFRDISENGIVVSGGSRDDLGLFGFVTVISDESIEFSDSFNQDIDLILVSSKTAPGIEIGDVAYILRPDNITYVSTHITAVNYLAGSSSELISVSVKNNLDFEYSSYSKLTIVKADRRKYNPNGLACSFRAYSSNSSNASAYVENPNAAYVVSENIMMPTETAKNISIEYDSGSVEIDVYNQNGPQSLEYIIRTLNLNFCDNRIPLSASEMKTESGRELCISHVLPNSIFFSKRPYIKVFESASDDFSSQNGLASYIDSVVYGTNENSSIINGNVLNYLFSPSDISSYCSITSGLKTLSISATAQVEISIRKRDLIYIEQNGSGVGLFDVRDISGSEIFFENETLFSFSSDGTTKVYLFKNNISSEGITYTGPSSSADRSMLVEISISDNGSIIRNKILEISGTPYYSQNNFVTQIRVIDLERKSHYAQAFSIIMDTEKYCRIETASEVGSKVYCPISGHYKIPFPDGDGFIEIYIITDKEMSGPSISLSVTMHEPSSKGLLKLSNILFSETLSYFSAPRIYSNINVAFSKDKRNVGVVGSDQISSRFRSVELNLPRSESAYNFVVSGMEASATPAVIDGFFDYVVRIQKGVSYVNGKRISSKTSDVAVRFSSDSSGAIIYIDSYGEIAVVYYASKLQSRLPKDYLPLYAIQPFSQSYPRTESPSNLCKKLFIKRSEGSLYPRTVTVGSGGNFRTITEAIHYFDGLYEIFAGDRLSCEILLDNETHILDRVIELGRYSVSFKGLGEECKIRISEEQELSNSPGSYGIDRTTSCFKITYTDISNLICTYTFNNIIFDYTNIVNVGVYCIIIIARSTFFSGRKITKFEKCSFLGSETLFNANNATASFILPFVLLPEVSESDPSKYVGDLYVENCYFRKIGDISLNGPVFFIGHLSSPETTCVDNLNFSNNILENCSVGDLRPFYNGSDVSDYSLTSTVTLTKNFISLGNKEYYTYVLV